MGKCELCSNINNYINYKPGSQTEAIFHDMKNNKYILVLEQFRNEYAELKIKYCPNCGRNLLKNKEESNENNNYDIDNSNITSI